MSDYDDLLAASLNSAFEPSPDIPKRRVNRDSISKLPSNFKAPAEPPSQSVPDLAPATTSETLSTAPADSWKEDYDKYVSHWREESAVARRKAEETRAMWEARRAEEARTSTGKKEQQSSEWEDLPQRTGSETMTLTESWASAASGPVGSSPADGRDLVTGESEGGRGKQILEAILPPIEQLQPDVPYPDSLNAPPSKKSSPPLSEKDRIESLAASHQWTHLHSEESSFPDISFPTSPKQEKKKEEVEPRPPSATLTIFDSSLSTRSRLLALTSSFGINFFLPFVNGVMLGFGEIFARNVVVWLGWRVPGGAATAVGVGAIGKQRRREMKD